MRIHVKSAGHCQAQSQKAGGALAMPRQHKQVCEDFGHLIPLGQVVFSWNQMEPTEHVRQRVEGLRCLACAMPGSDLMPEQHSTSQLAGPCLNLPHKGREVFICGYPADEKDPFSAVFAS